MWATEAEAYFSVSNSSNYDWLPQSPYNIWDIVVKDQDGADIKVPWKCEESGGITLDCDWKSSTGEPGISMAFAQQQQEVKTTTTANDDAGSGGNDSSEGDERIGQDDQADEVAPGSMSRN